MKKLITLVLLMFVCIAIIAQDTIKHTIPKEQQDDIFSIFSYMGAVVAGWVIGLFSRRREKKT